MGMVATSLPVHVNLSSPPCSLPGTFYDNRYQANFTAVSLGLSCKRRFLILGQPTQHSKWCAGPGIHIWSIWASRFHLDMVRNIHYRDRNSDWNCIFCCADHLWPIFCWVGCGSAVRYVHIQWNGIRLTNEIAIVPFVLDLDYLLMSHVF